uniref:Cleavage and polyadenylation specificity factor subunit 1 n=1 Tax=Caenorhabditis japonica TaxID=281687 RepID=A0A8R1HRB4_CAEJA
MHGYLRETDDSTTVNYSAYGKFIPGENTGQQLLTIGAKFIRIFRVNPYVLIEPGNDNEEWQQKTKLECMFSCRLLNACCSIAVSRIPQYPNQDSILLAFEDAKLSIVTFNEKERNLQTVSLHAFENEYLRDGFVQHFRSPIVRTDPSNRCAANLVYGKHIAILPFHENSKRIHSYIIPLKQIDARLDNVADMVFLDGYYEPTILFLYEPIQTTPGRACVRFDTMCIMGVSVNIVDRQFAVVWQISNLPMDCNSLLAVPKPLGGSMVFGTNTVIYLNQAVPPCGMILNSCYDSFTKFPLKDMRHMKLTLDCLASVYMEDGRIAVATRTGELYLLKLVTSSGGTAVKSLEFSKVYETSIAYCLTVCAPGHLFIGSRLGDSQLVEYTLVKTTKDSAKRQKQEKHQIEADFDEDDLELYGGAIEEQQNDDDEQVIESLQFKELDRLKNVGPVKSMCVGRPNYMSQELNDPNRRDPVFDVVTASGHGKNGALCVHQRSLRPDVITSSLLEGAEQLWAIGRKENESHKYLIVSRIRSTLILELGEEMVELEERLFVTSEPTVSAGELLQGALAVQVTSTCIALVTDGQQMQEVHIDSNFPVVQAAIVDPYVALLTQNGRLLLYELVMAPYVHLKEVDLSSSTFANSHSSSTQLTSISIYADASQMMNFDNTNEADAEVFTEGKKEPNGDFVMYGEDDEFLYGEAIQQTAVVENSSVDDYDGISQKTKNTRKRKRLGHDAIHSSRGGEQSDAIDPTQTYSKISHWLIVAHDNGRIVIHSLPDMAVVYQIGKFSNIPELLVDLTAEEEEKERKSKAQLASTDEEQSTMELKKMSEKVLEAQIVGMGINQAHPVLMAIVDEQVVLYEMFSSGNKIPRHLGIAFRKLPHFICLRTSPYLSNDGRRAPFEIEMENGKRFPLIHPFERISSVNNGLMIAGSVPTLLLYGAWGGMQAHQITLDGPIKAFTPFNNENVLHGFVYMTQQTSELRIARLQPDFDYDMPYPVKKIEIGRTLHHARYLMNSDVYVVVSSVPKASNKIWVVMNDDKQEEIHEKDEYFVLPEPPKYSLNLYSSQDWKAVPNTDIVFEDMEAVTACEDVALKSESTMSGLETLLAVGTVNNYGEEVLVRGRIILAEVIEVVPEPEQPTSNRKIKILYDKEQKGPVTGLCAMNGLLLSGMGQKVFIWQFKDNDLMGLSFLDMHYYVNQLHSLRTIALACDAKESISLIRFQEENKAMSISSRDDRKFAKPPMAAQFIVDGSRLGFVLSDEAGNITLFNYLPEAVESNGGERLSVRAAINIGTNINAFLRLKGHTALLNLTTEEEKETVEQKMTTCFATLDGSFGYIRPLTEKSYRKFHFLQTFLGSVAPQVAGLHVKGARSAKPPQPTVNGRNARNMIDGDVVEQYLHLSSYEKQDLARRLGVGRYHIIDDLLHLRRMAYYY